ncbi:DMT family transporter [Tropicimonas sp. IMCC34043]|uniref:DMT family transporter n=1 Tax=Tropicimonas sp. IMCC34043 TaxID=2248760 RepID=UPI000E2855CB|nr:DMT family transporter [Tropicimonas sp. IMCC34043]
MTARYWILVAILGIGWGGSFIFNAMLLAEVGPLSVAFLRMALGAVTCWVYVLAKGRRVPWGWRLLGSVLVLGVLNYAIPFAIYPLAQRHITSGVAGIVNAMTPIMVVIVSHFWPGGEKASRTKSLGIGFGFAGIVILMAPGLRGGAGRTELWAILAALLAPLCYGVALNWLRRLKGIDAAVIAALALSAGALAIAPAMLAIEGVPQLTRPESWMALAMIGPVLTGLFFIVFYWLVPLVGATNASTVTFIAPVSAVVLGRAMLGEAVRIEQLAGMVLIFVGLLAIDGRIWRLIRRRRRVDAAHSKPFG